MQMLLNNRNGLKPALPQVPGRAQARVDSQYNGDARTGRSAAIHRCPPRGDDVNMVRHLAIGPDCDPRLPGKRGPASHLEQQLDAVTRLPKAKQKIVAELLDSGIVKAQMEAQHVTG